VAGQFNQSTYNDNDVRWNEKIRSTENSAIGGNPKIGTANTHAGGNVHSLTPILFLFGTLIEVLRQEKN